MGFIRPDADAWKRTMSRVLVSGGPNTGKTRSLITCKRPVYVISYPGEGGTNSIPQEEGIMPLMWVDDADSRASSRAVVDEVRASTIEMITSENCVTFFGDGIHKLYEYFLDTVTAGDYFRGNEFDTILYQRAHVKFMEYIKLVRESAVPYVFFTAWDARDPDKPELKSKSPMHVYPDLPGKMSRRIMGEFSIVIASHATPSAFVGKPPRFYWQLKANSEVHGAMIKIDPRIAEHLPAEVDQDWQALERLLMEAGEKVKQGVKAVLKPVVRK
jgi:hypothetical protein